MNVELLGMNNEELIQWACRQAPIDEGMLRLSFPDIEAYCAVRPISTSAFMERVVVLASSGVRLRRAIRCIRLENLCG